MANTITQRTLVNGPRRVVQQVQIAGDGSGEETDLVVLDASVLEATSFAVEKVEYDFGSFAGTLEFDATTDVPIARLAASAMVHDWTAAGGIADPKGAGYTGDVLLTTIGLGAAEVGTLTIWAHKKG